MLAQRMYRRDVTINSVTSLLDHCEECMDFTPDHKPKPGHFPLISRTGTKIDQLSALYGGTGRRTVGNSYFIDHQVAKKNKKLPLRKSHSQSLLRKEISGSCE